MRTILLTLTIWLLSTTAWGQGLPAIDTDSPMWELIDSTFIIKPHPKAVELLNPVTIFYVDTVGWTGKLVTEKICPYDATCSMTAMWPPSANYCTSNHGYIDSTYVAVPIVDTIVIATFWIDEPYKRMNDWRVKQ